MKHTIIQKQIQAEYPKQGILLRDISFVSNGKPTAAFSEGETVNYKTLSDGTVLIAFIHKGVLTGGATINYNLFQ